MITSAVSSAHLNKPMKEVCNLTSVSFVLHLSTHLKVLCAISFSSAHLPPSPPSPPSASLGRAPNTEIFRNRKDFKKVHNAAYTPLAVKLSLLLCTVPIGRGRDGCLCMYVVHVRIQYAAFSLSLRSTPCCSHVL